jgi:hypothetical protein
MGKEKPKLSWQGIGISSNPFQKEEPLSLHLQAYLEEAADSAENHTLVIADSMQVTNYRTIYGLTQSEAERIALRKGREKQKGLERILRARGIRNVKVLCFSDIYGSEQEKTLKAVQEVYHQDPKIREAVIKCIPKRLIRKAKDLEMVAKYALTEISLILSMEGVKFGHEKEKGYDKAALMINQKYGIGNMPQFTYSKKGLEFVSGRGASVEPYSSLVSGGRFLLTDSKRQFKGKVDGLSEDEFEKAILQLREDGMDKGEEPSKFYDRMVAPTRRELRKPRRRLMGLAASIAAGLIGLVSAAGYVHEDAENIRQFHCSQISIWGLNGDMNTCHGAVNDAITKANKDIQAKYHLKNYFRTFKNGRTK